MPGLGVAHAEVLLRPVDRIEGRGQRACCRVLDQRLPLLSGESTGSALPTTVPTPPHLGEATGPIPRDPLLDRPIVHAEQIGNLP
jgi:hypothetical protein